MTDVAKLIPSKDVLRYMEQRGRMLTDYEKATLIYNHSEMPYMEKTILLSELMTTTLDEKLKEEIRSRLFYDEICLSSFYKNKGTCIYKMEICDSEEQMLYECRYYQSAEIAIFYGKKFKKKFKVNKIGLVTGDKELENENSDNIATVYFNDLGQVMGYFSSEIELDTKRLENDKGRFENAYIEILHPFRDGDFVSVKNIDWLKGKICLVECSDQGRTTETQSAVYDYRDATLRVAYINDAGRFGHEHVKIVDLEYATPNLADEEYALLYCAQNLLCGNGGLSDFQFLCDDYYQKLKNRR